MAYQLTPLQNAQLRSRQLTRSVDAPRTIDLIPQARMSAGQLQADAMRRAQAANASVAAANREIQRLRRQADANSVLLRRLVGTGGTFNTGSRNMNLSPYVVPSTPGKGGILPTEAAAFGASDPAGTSVSVAVPSWARSRLTGTFVEGVTLVGTGGLASTSELAKIEFSMFVNDQTIAALNRVPCDVAAATLDGPQIIPASVYIGADVELTVDFDVLITLTAASAGEVFLRMWCGDGDSYDLPVKMR